MFFPIIAFVVNMMDVSYPLGFYCNVFVCVYKSCPQSVIIKVKLYQTFLYYLILGTLVFLFYSGRPLVRKHYQYISLLCNR